MTDENTDLPDPKVLERHQDKAMLRFLFVATSVLIITIVIVGVLLALLLRQVDEDFRHLQATRSAEHACLARKEDQFRKDVAALLANPHPGATFPAADSIQCVIVTKRGE